MVTCKKPVECSADELQSFKDFVLDGDEVEPAGLDDRIAAAESLLFLAKDGDIKGVAAIKNPNDHYKDSVFAKAHAPENAEGFCLELGWVFVDSSVRGNGYSHNLVERAIAIADGQPIFATSRNDNQPMHKVLMKHGFRKCGVQYASNRGNHHLVLFLYPGAQQGAAPDRHSATLHVGR